jgi:hypothetical protein
MDQLIPKALISFILIATWASLGGAILFAPRQQQKEMSVGAWIWVVAISAVFLVWLVYALTIHWEPASDDLFTP